MKATSRILPPSGKVNAMLWLYATNMDEVYVEPTLNRVQHQTDSKHYYKENDGDGMFEKAAKDSILDLRFL